MEEKRIDYRNRWQKENQDRIVVMVKKGEKARIKEHAAECGLSVNAYILALIETDLGKRTGEDE